MGDLVIKSGKDCRMVNKLKDNRKKICDSHPICEWVGLNISRTQPCRAKTFSDLRQTMLFQTSKDELQYLTDLAHNVVKAMKPHISNDRIERIKDDVVKATQPRMLRHKSEVGQGGFSTVYNVECTSELLRDFENNRGKYKNASPFGCAIDETTKQYLIKFVNDPTSEDFIREKLATFYLKGIPNIAVALQHGKCKKDGEEFHCLKLENAGTELFKYMHEEKEDYRRFPMRKVVSELYDALIAMHKKKVVHLDIKPENIVYKSDTQTASFIDFGLSHFGDDITSIKTPRGTPYYMGCDLVKIFFGGAKTFDGRFVDYWALAVTFYEMITFKLPFDAESKKILFSKIANAEMENNMQYLHPSIQTDDRKSTQNELYNLFYDYFKSNISLMYELSDPSTEQKRHELFKKFMKDFLKILEPLDEKIQLAQRLVSAHI